MNVCVCVHGRTRVRQPRPRHASAPPVSYGLHPGMTRQQPSQHGAPIPFLLPTMALRWPILENHQTSPISVAHEVNVGESPMRPPYLMAAMVVACRTWGMTHAFVIPPVARTLAALRPGSRGVGCAQLGARGALRFNDAGGLQAAEMQGGNADGQNQIVRFQAADMEIRRQVGEMGYATITDWEYYQARNPLDPNQPLRTVDAAGPSLRLWEARVARGPLRNARMLLKEYFASARDVAETELRVYTDLVDTYPRSEDFGKYFPEVSRIERLHSKYIRSLTFENLYRRRARGDAARVVRDELRG
jgi:hypothetical protein